MKALPLGIMDYRKLITDDYYAVDKSLIIKDFLERKSAVTIITRPRRFGKTLNMSMMAEFFDITKDSTDLFKNTKIMKTKYAENINQYPTIFISFAGAKGTKQSISKSIKLQLRKEYDRYNQIFLNISEFDKDEYKLIKKELFQLTDSTLDNIENALSFLMEQLEGIYR